MQHWFLTSRGLTDVRELPAALLYGYCAYTTFRVPIAPVWLQRHLERLEQDAKALGMFFPGTVEHTLSQIPDFWRAPGILRLSVLPQIESFQGLWRTEGALPSQMLASFRTSNQAFEASPLSLKSFVYERPMPQIKHGSLAGDLSMRRQAVLEGFQEVVWVNRQGHVTEASTANVFFLRGDVLYTPDPERDGCLPGLTRRRVLEIANPLGLRVSSQVIDLSELSAMEGVFLTNAVLGIQPVSQIDAVSFAWPVSAQETLKRLEASVREEAV